ncbi:hypothetical protein SAMN04488543_1213 [Friedmanniella luteola]|uniref:Uncharacterized protein n=1 Tax=Friedmanniella luteola TaxID=546871 RepID=A0A1H1Q1N7_9ACTN|nr:hypothetical protein [Friedmanniella luteola]SDS17177.1 hypothetical protein SAMN04488543_1213 [Friedmanniella luteola]
MLCTAVVNADASGTNLVAHLTARPAPEVRAAGSPAHRHPDPAGEVGDCTGLPATGAAGDATASPARPLSVLTTLDSGQL